MNLLRRVLPACLLVLTAVGLVHAEARTRLTDESIVLMGPEKFSELYCAERGWSEVTQDFAASTYARARRRLNDRDARRIAPAARREIGLLRKNLADLSNSWFESQYGLALGGTMYGHCANRAVADREDAIGSFIAAWRLHAAPDTSARLRALAAVDTMRATIEAQQWTETDTMFEEQRQGFIEAKASLARAAETLRVQLGRLPDRVADLSAAYATRSLLNLFGED